MLNYRTSVYLFLAIMLAMAYLYYAALISIGYLIIPIFLFGFLLFYGAYFIQSGFFVKAICSGSSDKNEVALTFDDGPVEFNTNLILDVLKINKVPSAFFCIGKRMIENPTVLKRIHEEGHIIGNHSFSHHFLFDLLPKKKMIHEMEETNRVAENIIHQKLTLFRPPYGVTTPILANAIREKGFKTIGWSLRSYDTMMKDEQALKIKIETNIKAGDVILLHDSQNVTVNALQTIIDSVRNKGFTLVRLDQLLNIKAYD